MPFIQRQVEPVFLAQDAGKTVDDQEDLQSRILANIMDQLGDLGRHAADIMAGIGKECEEVNVRMASLSQRLDKVGVLTKNFDINGEDPSIMVDPSEVQKLCESSKSSQLLTPASRPTAVQERYNQAEPPPKVHILQHVRDAHADPKLPEEKKIKCLKLYSDPSFFYQHWMDEMLASTEKKRKEKEGKKEEKGKNRKKKKREERRVITGIGDIETIDDLIRKTVTGTVVTQQEIVDARKSFRKTQSFRDDFDPNQLDEYKDPQDDQSKEPQPAATSIAPPPPPPPGARGALGVPPTPPNNKTVPVVAPTPTPPALQAQVPQASSQPASTTGPPPPPPPPIAPPPPPPLGCSGLSSGPQPPKPPPPSSGGGLTMQEEIAMGKTLKSTPAPAPKQVDARSGLLQQIAAGKKLKKVDMTEKKQEPKKQEGMFGAIEDALDKRMKAMHSDDEDEDDDSDDEWD